MTMITREEAIDVLMEMLDSSIIDEEYKDKVQDIVNCLEAERIGRHEWGVPRSLLSTLYVAKRIDLITEEDTKKYDRIHRDVLFTPSKLEKAELESNVTKRIEDTTWEEVESEDVDEWFRRV